MTRLLTYGYGSEEPEEWVTYVPTNIALLNRNGNHSKSLKLYDLQGRRLQGKPSKGVYIQDGKKYMVK